MVEIKGYTEEEFIRRTENRKALNEALLGFTMEVAGAAAELAAGPTYTGSYVTYHAEYNSGLVSYRNYSYHPGVAYFLKCSLIFNFRKYRYSPIRMHAQL